ncbi:MAG TPA: BTAD domain-containing putative transcriptional regulator, partial [Longimicrobiales bacterium]
MIRLFLLGEPDLRDAAGTELRSVLSQPKRFALLAYLARTASDGFCRRDRLFAVFWPEFDDERARLALRQALHFLRRSLGTGAITNRGDEEIGIDSRVLWCDAVAFQQAVETRRAQEAMELYRGDLLPSFHIADTSAEFEQWLEHERAELRAAAAEAAWQLCEQASVAGDTSKAIQRAREAISFAPDDEAGVRKLIRVLDHAGDRAGALRAYEAFANRLRDEFESEPAAETRALIESVRTRNSASPHVHATVPTRVSADGPVESVGRSRRILEYAIPAVAIAAALIFGVVKSRAPRAATGTPLLAVGWIENQAGASSGDVARLIPGLLATNLSRVDGLAVVSDARIYELLSHQDGNPENAQAMTEAARRAGADELLQGVLYRRRDRLRLDLRRVDLRTGVVRDVFTAEGADVFELTDRATQTVARAFALDEPRLPASETSTRSLTARRFYEEGLHAYYRGADARSTYDLFAAAMREDTTFAMAALYAAFSRSLYDVKAANELYTRSVRLAEHAPERDRLLIKLFTKGSDYAVVAATAETLVVRFPNEPHGHMVLGLSRAHAGDFVGAIRAARRVLSMDSLSLSGKGGICRACEAYSTIVNAYLGLDSFPAAERTTREWIRRQPNSRIAWSTLWTILRNSGQREKSLEALRMAEKLDPSAGATTNQVLVALHADDYTEAERLLRARLGYDPRDLSAMWYLIISLRNEGRLTEALAVAQRGRNVSQNDGGSRLAYGQVLFESRRYGAAAALFDSLAHNYAVSGPLDTRGLLASHLAWMHTHAAAARAAAGDT